MTIMEGLEGASTRPSHPQVRKLAAEEMRGRQHPRSSRSRDREVKRLTASDVVIGSSSAAAAAAERRGRRRSPRDSSVGSSLLVLPAPGQGQDLAGGSGSAEPRVGSHYERYSLRSSSRDMESDEEGDGEAQLAHRRRPRFRRHSSSYRSDGSPSAAASTEQHQQDGPSRRADETTPLLRRQGSMVRSQSTPLSMARPRTPRLEGMDGVAALGADGRGEEGADTGASATSWWARLWGSLTSCVCVGKRR